MPVIRASFGEGDRIMTLKAPVYISIDHLTHTFDSSDDGQVTAFKDVSIAIRRGELVSLVGQSGCGKSTLLNVVAGLISSTEGAIMFLDSEGSKAEPTIGYITQEDRLLPWRTLLDNTVLPLELQKVPKAQRRQLARSLLERVGLGAFLEKRPDQLSGGMRQRASIARALTLQPDILLMDEPFGALDAWTRHALHELLCDVRKEYNTTVLLVTHDVHEALALSDKIITLAPRPGRVLAEYPLPEGPLPRSITDIHSSTLYTTFTTIRRDLGLKD